MDIPVGGWKTYAEDNALEYKTYSGSDLDTIFSQISNEGYAYWVADPELDERTYLVDPAYYIC